MNVIKTALDSNKIYKIPLNAVASANAAICLIYRN